MGTIFKIALRNVLRNKRRTILTGLTIMFGIMFFIFMDSVMQGMDRGSIQNIINYSDSSLKIQTEQYNKEADAMPLKYGIKRIDEIEKFFKQQKYVEGVTHRTRFMAEVSGYDNSVKVIGMAVDPQKDGKVFYLKDLISNKTFFTGDGTGQVIIGKKLAEDLGVGVGDTLVVAANTKYASQNAEDLEIVGIMNSSDPVMNASTVIISYAEANQLLDLENLVTEINVRVKWDKGMPNERYLERIDNIKAAFMKKFKGYSIITFREIAAPLFALIKQKMAAGYIFLFLMLLIGLVGIVNSVLISVYERIREVGVLKALGFRPKEITRMFMFEGLLIGVVGSFMGLIAGALIDILLIYKGYNLEAMSKGVDATGFPMWGVIYGQWNPAAFVWLFFVGVITAVIAARIPAKKAAKMSVTRCLRFV